MRDRKGFSSRPLLPIRPQITIHSYVWYAEVPMARGPHSRATGRLWWYGVVLSQVWMNALGARYIQRLFILVPGSCISGPWGGEVEFAECPDTTEVFCTPALGRRIQPSIRLAVLPIIQYGCSTDLVSKYIPGARSSFTNQGLTPALIMGLIGTRLVL